MPIRSQGLIPLISGAYKARNDIGSDIICENCFPELNPEEIQAPAPMTHYPREGLVALSSPPTQGLGRGIFTLSNGMLVAAVGSSFYTIDNSFNWTLQGSISNLSTPISVTDNGNAAMIVDGTNVGYQLIFSPLAFSRIVDSTGTFSGSVSVDFADTYIAFATPNSNSWGVTNPNSITFNAFQVANKDSTPDFIQTLKFNLRVAWLLGTYHSEIWFLAGSTPFPYEEWPNIFVPFGCAAPYSLVQSDISLFWLSRNEQGQAIAISTRGYGVEAFSTRALEYEWSTYPTVADCIGGTFQQAGHTFVIFHFPSADKTWAYDLSSKQWHARIYIDNNGKRHREKVSFYAQVSPQGGFPTSIIGQDWSTGQIYRLDPKAYDDAGQPIVCRRSFPHQVADLYEITPTEFIADFATGAAQGIPQPLPDGSDFNSDFNDDFGPIGGQAFVPKLPGLYMRYSKTGGQTWSSYRFKGRDSSGDYRSMMRFRGLGMGRDWVFEVMWVYPGPSALNGAYLPAPIKHGA